MRERGCQFAHQRKTSNARQFDVLALMIQLRLLSIRDVNARADITQKRAIIGESWRSTIQNPAIFTVISSQAILHCKRLSRIEGILVSVEAVREVVRMNPLCPAIAQFLFHCASGKIEPAFVEKGAEFVRARHPDHD